MAIERTFLVVHPDEAAPVIRDVADGRVLTLAEPPQLPDGPLGEREIVEGRVEPATPQAVTWRLAAVADRWTVTVERVPESPTTQAAELAADTPVGEVVRRPRAGEGELHVLPVPPGRATDAAADVAADEATVERAARLGVGRVEIRTGDDLVSIRYLP